MWNTLVKLVAKSPARELASRVGINHFAALTAPRPRPFSLWSEIAKPGPHDLQGPVSDYTSWPVLTNRIFSGRHPPG